MSGTLSSLRRRLSKVEQQLSELPRCICRTMTEVDATKPQEFVKEMNQRCPFHGLRYLGIIHLKNVGQEEQEERAWLNQLLESYKARRFPRAHSDSELRQAGFEVRNG